MYEQKKEVKILLKQKKKFRRLKSMNKIEEKKRETKTNQ